MTVAGTVIVMPQPTWETRDPPILVALVEMFDNGGAWIEPAEIEAKTGLDAETVQGGLRALMHADPELIDVTTADTYEGPWVGAVNYVTGAARQAVGTWPSPEGLADEIVAALQAVAEKAPAEERSKLRNIAGWLGSAGHGFLIEVTAATANRYLGNT